MPPADTQPSPNQPQIITPGQPPTPAGPVTSGPITASPPPAGRSLKKIIALVVGLVILVVAAGISFTMYQKSAATKKFNSFAAKVTKQENDGADRYVKVAGIVNDFGQLLDISTDGNTTGGTDKLTAKLNGLKTDVNQACQDKAGDITAANFDQPTKGLKLNANQKKYLADWKTVISNLESSDYSNAGLCSDGQLLVIVANNMLKFVPGIQTLTDIENSASGEPTAAQLESLKSFTTIEISDQDKLSASLPHTATFLGDLKSLMSDLYNEASAEQRGDNAAVQRYLNDILTISDSFDKTSAAVDDEISAYDQKINDGAISASKAELAGIEYQNGHKSGNANMQLDPALPAFRIVEASISNYSDKHDSAYPHASNVAGLADIDSTIKGLKDKGYLKDFTYTSTGADDSGFTLTAKLANGKTLSEKVEPSSQST